MIKRKKLGWHLYDSIKKKKKNMARRSDSV